MFLVHSAVQRMKHITAAAHVVFLLQISFRCKLRSLDYVKKTKTKKHATQLWFWIKIKPKVVDNGWNCTRTVLGLQVFFMWKHALVMSVLVVLFYFVRIIDVHVLVNKSSLLNTFVSVFFCRWRAFVFVPTHLWSNPRLQQFNRYHLTCILSSLCFLFLSLLSVVSRFGGRVPAC